MHKRATNPSARKSHRLGIIICALGTFFYCYEFILRIIPGILQEELRWVFGNLSAASFGQVAALYYYAYSPMQLPVGIMMDRFGPRYLLTLACLCCTIGSLLFSFPTLWVAGVGRLLMGFGSSFAFVGVLSATTNWLPLRYFSLVAGLMTTVGMLGLVYGEIEITHLANHLGYKTVLHLMIYLGLILTILLYAIVRDAPNQQQHHPMPYREFFIQVWLVLKSKQIWMIAIIGMFLYTSLSIFGELWGKSFLELAFGLSKSKAANTMSLLFIGWAVGAPLSGYLSDLIGNRLLLLTISAIAALVLIGFILYDQNLTYFQLNLYMFLYGLASASEITVFIMAKEHSPNPQLSGTIFAVTNMIVSFGGVIFQPLVGALVDWSTQRNAFNPIHVYRTEHYQMGLSLLPLSMLAVIGLALYMKKTAPVSSVRL